MPAEYQYFADLANEMPEIPADSILSRTFFTDGQLKAILFGFAPGQELSEHTSTHPAIIHILKGQARLSLGADSYEAGEGAWAYMNPNLPHGLVAITPVTMLLTLLPRPTSG
jgi:quercetin dioxygenase-like cupin family protein